MLLYILLYDITVLQVSERDICEAAASLASSLSSARLAHARELCVSTKVPINPARGC